MPAKARSAAIATTGAAAVPAGLRVGATSADRVGHGPAATEGAPVETGLVRVVLARQVEVLATRVDHAAMIAGISVVTNARRLQLR